MVYYFTSSLRKKLWRTLSIYLAYLFTSPDAGSLK
jgi:hypothetical protein